ncbi:MAG: PepSY domain-containing protein [Firmicutes bacterium]|nr:PepSY domain-containing protein [Bacillota bacterium]
MKRTLRTLLIAALAMALVFTMTGMAFAGSEMTVEKAYKIALKDAGLTSSDVRCVEKDYDREDKVYEIEFIKKGAKTEYEYEISSTGKILKKSVDYNRAVVKGSKKLTKADAINVVVKTHGFKKTVVSKKGRIKLEKDGGQWVYEMKFRSGSYRYEYEVHAATGKILEYSKKLAA